MESESRGFFAANPHAMRMNAAPRTAVYHLGVAWLLVIVAWTPWGRALLGIHPLFLTLSTVAFSLDLVELARRVEDGSLFTPKAWPRRVLTTLVLLVYTASFAAPSSLESSAAWAFFVMAGAIAGLIGTHLGPAFIALLLITGPGFHGLAAPEATPRSMLTALAAVLFAALAALLGRWLARLAIELERRAEARALAGEAAREEMRRLATAMSVHDGLSGMLFSLRARLEQAQSAAEVTTALQAFVQRARETILPVVAPLDLKTALSSIAAFAAVPTTLTGTAPNDPLESSDLAFAALELASNALRHRDVSALDIHLLSGAEHGIRVTARGPLAARQPTSSGGRGTRHLALRARAWGGTSTRVDEENTSVAEVRWPKPAARIGPLWLALVAPLTAAPLALLLLAEAATPELVAYLLAVSVLTSAGLAYDARALRFAATLFLPRPLPTPALSSALVESFSGALAALEAAAHTGALSAMRERLETVGRNLTALLAALESDAHGPSGAR